MAEETPRTAIRRLTRRQSRQLAQNIQDATPTDATVTTTTSPASASSALSSSSRDLPTITPRGAIRALTRQPASAQQETRSSLREERPIGRRGGAVEGVTPHALIRNVAATADLATPFQPVLLQESHKSVTPDVRPTPFSPPDPVEKADQVAQSSTADWSSTSEQIPGIITLPTKLRAGRNSQPNIPTFSEAEKQLRQVSQVNRLTSLEKQALPYQVETFLDPYHRPSHIPNAGSINKRNQRLTRGPGRRRGPKPGSNLTKRKRRAEASLGDDDEDESELAPRIAKRGVFGQSATHALFKRYAKGKQVSKEALERVVDLSDQYWRQNVETLQRFSRHARKVQGSAKHDTLITREDVELLFHRHRLLGDSTMQDLIRTHLPAEMRNQVLPVARAGNIITPIDQKFD